MVDVCRTTQLFQSQLDALSSPEIPYSLDEKDDYYQLTMKNPSPEFATWFLRRILPNIEGIFFACAIAAWNPNRALATCLKKMMAELISRKGGRVPAQRETELVSDLIVLDLVMMVLQPAKILSNSSRTCPCRKLEREDLQLTTGMKQRTMRR